MRKMNQSLKELKEEEKRLRELEDQHIHKGFFIYHTTGKISETHLKKGRELSCQLQEVVVEIQRREGAKLVLLGF